jgi:hypothetical protein
MTIIKGVKEIFGDDKETGKIETNYNEERGYLLRCLGGSLELKLLTLYHKISGNNNHLILFYNKLGRLNIDDICIRGEGSGNDGGIFIDIVSSLSCSINLLVVNDIKFSNGNIISLKDGNMNIKNSLFSEISQISGNGSCLNGIASFLSKILVDGCIFNNCEAIGDVNDEGGGCGGAIYFNINLRGSFEIMNSEFINCSANVTNGYGGGICLYVEDDVYEYILKDLIFTGIFGGMYGKWIFVDMDNLTSVAGEQFSGILF